MHCILYQILKLKCNKYMTTVGMKNNFIYENNVRPQQLTTDVYLCHRSDRLKNEVLMLHSINTILMGHANTDKESNNFINLFNKIIKVNFFIHTRHKRYYCVILFLLFRFLDVVFDHYFDTTLIFLK